MENNKDKEVVSEGKGYVCTCCGHYGMGGMGHGMCCGHHWMGGRILRIVIALLVALFIFWVGVKAGEVRSGLYGGGIGNPRGGYYMMGGYGTPAAGGYYGGTMAPGRGLIPQGGTAPTSTTGGPNVY